MIRFLIAVLRPTDKQLRKRKPSSLLRLKVWLYTAIVGFMAKAYRRCAVHDILLMPEGLRVEIEERDTDFEQEMQLAHIGVNSRWRRTSLRRELTLDEPRHPRWLSHCFRWQRSVRVISPDGRSVMIDHTRQTVLSGNMSAAAEVVGNDVGLESVRLLFATSGASRRASSVVDDDVSSQPDAPRTAPQRRRRRVPPPTKVPESIIAAEPAQPQAQPPAPKRVKRTPPPVPVAVKDPPGSTGEPGNEIPPEAMEPKPKPKPQLKKMQGFDMDDSF